ncbi:MAG TPA: hypothetical protein VFL51_17195 [Pseudolabrys sp.]|nr:hypothetical protein [Pseudolabrys sp.]
MATKVLLILLVAISCMMPGISLVHAADYPLHRSSREVDHSKLPFPRSERAQSIWASDACWSGCGARCVWGLVSCIRRDDQGRCLASTNGCDRYCQRMCRTYGGPLVPDLFDFQDRPFVLR